MDKSWMKLSRVSDLYIEGVKGFLEFAYVNKVPGSLIKCPCKKCCNTFTQKKEVVYEHLIIHGFVETYINWIYHGEVGSYTTFVQKPDKKCDLHSNDDICELVQDALGRQEGYHFDDEQHVDEEELNENTLNFFKLLKDAECELYPGCTKFSLLSFVVRLFHMKVLHKWSHTSFTFLLQLLKDAFPLTENFPDSYLKARKIVRDLGFDYQKIDACPNNCTLYWKESKDCDECAVCHTSRWKKSTSELEVGNTKDHKIAAKVIRYFPLIPRLQRLFMSSKTASLMRWHEEERNDDGILRHPADSKAWKTFNKLHSEFSEDVRNVRLGLASDGFNPFKTMSIAHSTWPVVLTIYNLPPWLCMKQPYLILSTIIDGPRGPGNNIDVYLQPLIDELNELWHNGVLTYDAHSKKMFLMHAALMWTISDFPAYANLSGWSTKGRLACPCCNKNTRSMWLKYSRKFSYIGHRRWLNSNHRFRNDKISFDGTVESENQPIRLSGNDLLAQLDAIKIFNYESQPSMSKKRKGNNDGRCVDSLNWKKKSIFFQLPYWKDNLIIHNLDVMHVEKNVCDNILWTLLSINGKSKDGVKARRDIEAMGIRKSLHLRILANNKVYMPPASFSMTKDDKDRFFKVLKNIKVPDGYASNISRRVKIKERSISGLKSHDSHIIMQQLLPIAIRRSLPKHVVKPLIELSNFFQQLCSTTISEMDFKALQDRVVVTLCHLEKIFPPSFFDIMEHLVIHLGEEAMMAGPVQFRWMYPIERFLLTLKDYVRNRSHPEGSIAEGYLSEECMTFCVRYLDDVESKLNRTHRNYEGYDMSCGGVGRALGKEELFQLDNVAFVQAHRYVLFNSTAVTPFLEKHIAFLKHEKPRVRQYDINRTHNETFHSWFGVHVRNLKKDVVSKEVSLLAAGPSKWARRYTGYIINGFRFRTKNREKRKITQNCGVVMNADIQSYASARDKRPILGEVTYYGVLTDIIELRYSNDLKFILFRCDWVDNHTGKIEDEFGFTLVNFKHLLYKHNRLSDEPFILASQARQAWYVQDPVKEDWQIVMKVTPKDLYDMYGKDCHENIISVSQVEPFINQELDETTNIQEDDVLWVRNGVEGTTVDEIAAKDINDGLDYEIDEVGDDDLQDYDDNSNADQETNESDLEEDTDNDNRSDEDDS